VPVCPAICASNGRASPGQNLQESAALHS
jgi:hypothetical protein